MATENKKKNFFLLLGFNPDESWDQAKFEQVLAGKVGEWKKLSTGISTPARDAQRNLEMVPEIRDIMGDSAKRNAHAHAAKEELITERAARRKQCDTQLEIEQSKKFLYDTELQKLIHEFSDVYSKQEILARVTVKILCHSSETLQEQQRLDQIIAADIADSLKFLGLERLYELLELPQITSTQELCLAAEQLYADMVKRRPETIEVKERKKLAGYAGTIFKSEETRRQYDESLRELALDPLFKHLDPVVERDPGKVVYKTEIDWFLDKTTQLGWSEESAYSKLIEHARQQKWFLRPDPVDKNARKKQNAETLRYMIEHKQLRAADEFLKGLKAGEIADRQRFQREIDTGMAKADELVKKAQALFITSEAKIHHCRTALRFCVDCKEAYGLLTALLPAPRNLQAHVNDTVVTLTWEPSLQDMSYKVIRKSGSQPESDEDGLYLATVTSRMYQDTTLEVGVPAFYAVFAVCDGVASIDGAKLRQPVLLTQEITNEMVLVDNQLVELSWQVPPNVHAVVVVRKEKTPPIPPISIHDGTLLSLHDMTRVVDCCVQNNITYHYGIFCQFRDHEGIIRNTPGRVISVTPEALPEPIKYLDIERTKLANGFEVQICWEPPVNGNRVILLKSRQQISFDQGKFIPVSQLSQYGEEVPGEGNIRKDVWQEAGIRYYTPAIISRDIAYFGPSHRFICGEDVIGLKCQKVGTALRLDWKWPENCQEAVIYYGNKNYPLPQSHEAIMNTYRVTRSEYVYFGHFEINGTSNQDYYIVVAAIVEHEGERIITPGDRLHVYLPCRMIIEYEIKRQRFGPKKRFLHLTTQTPGRLPPLRLVSQRHRVPVNKNDGDEFFRWADSIIITDKQSITLPDTAVSPDTFVGLFLEDDSAYEFVDVRHPGKEKLRLD